MINTIKNSHTRGMDNIIPIVAAKPICHISNFIGMEYRDIPSIKKNIGNNIRLPFRLIGRFMVPPDIDNKPIILQNKQFDHWNTVCRNVLFRCITKLSNKI